MTANQISIIICAHNPRPGYLRRVLDALKAQTLPMEEWELLLVDNASKEPLITTWDLAWHPRARHIREDELGLTPARLRGIRESSAEIIVFVDDDNVLAPTYLRQALEKERTFPMIGVWGGRIDLEFEVPPPEWTRRLWGNLALRQIERSYWTNLVGDLALLPCGAGLCVRRNVAEAHARVLIRDVERRALGRKGALLTSCEDTDLALTACDLGYGYGSFTELRLVHLIPKGRLEEDYLLRLEEGITFSSSLLRAKRSGVLPSRPSGPLRRKLGAVRRRLTMKRIDRLILEARLRGWSNAHAAAVNRPLANGTNHDSGDFPGHSEP